MPLRDLGEHRFKDLSAPERVYQLGSGEFPALKTLLKTNLPVPQTPFLGREKELGEVLGLLGRDDVRLLTLTGPGGTGKTRLAAQAAAALAERYPHGVWWVPLAGVRDSVLVLESASQVVGAKNGLASHISDQAMLLLFDNFEHVVEAASGLGSLLEACPNLELMVTSREPLHLAGEQEYPVQPLAHEEAVGLFAARARSVDPGFQVDDAVRGICRRLDELPLALELAAARVKALSTRQILERLERRLPLLTGGARDVPERQRTLQAAIGWSYDLLSADEQRLFVHLSVFAGGCTLEAAEEVCDAELDALQSLVEKSLVRFTNERYWMLETIREYAAGRLEESGEDAEDVSRRHAQWLLELAERAEPELRGPDVATWLGRLDADLGNFRAAVAWATTSQRRLALSLVSALTEYWHLRGYWLEAGRLLDAAWDENAPVELRKRALRAYGFVTMNLDDVPRLVTTQRERLELARATDDLEHVGGALSNLGAAARLEGDLAVARELAEESVDVALRMGDDARAAVLRGNLAVTVRDMGDLAMASALLEECLAALRRVGDEAHALWALQQLGETAIDEGDFVRAADFLREALALAGRLGAIATSNLLWNVAYLAAARGDAAEAPLFAGADDELRRRGGRVLFSEPRDDSLPVMKRYVAGLERIRTEIGAARFDELYERGRSLELEEAVDYARRYLD